MVLCPAKIPSALQRFVVYRVVYRVFIAKTTKSLEKQQNFRPTGQDNLHDMALEKASSSALSENPLSHPRPTYFTEQSKINGKIGHVDILHGDFALKIDGWTK